VSWTVKASRRRMSIRQAAAVWILVFLTEPMAAT
jgi:hypothetical protein